MANISTGLFDTDSFALKRCIQHEIIRGGGGGGGSVERATPGEEVPGSIPAVAARSLLAGSVSV